MAYDPTTTVIDNVTDNLAQYHNELVTAITHVMSATPYSGYVYAASMTGNVTLTDADLPVQSFSPTAARDLTLPAVASANHGFYVINRSGTYAITVKNASSSTVYSLTAGTSVFLISDGANNWYAIGGGGSGSGSAGFAGISNLTANNNATTPDTKYDFTASEVILKNPSSGVLVSVTSGATITCDITLPASGSTSTANGCDQSKISALTSVWVHFYYIYNGTTLATIASQNAPSTGPTLPSGYTSWAYIGVIRLDASSHLLLTRIRGNRIWYEMNQGGANRLLSAGVATSFTDIACSTLVPPNYLMVTFIFQFNLSNTSAATYAAYGRPKGSSLTTGAQLCATRVNANGYTGVSATALDMPLGTSDTIQYKLSSAPSSGGFYVDVLGYTIPNRAV